MEGRRQVPARSGKTVQGLECQAERPGPFLVLSRGSILFYLSQHPQGMIRKAVKSLLDDGRLQRRDSRD